MSGLSKKAQQRERLWREIPDEYLDSLEWPEEVAKSKWLVNAILARLDFLSLLEVGCGTGRNLRILQPRVGPSVRLAGCDVCPRALERARRVLPGVDLREASLYQLPYGNGQFGAVLLCSVLMFVPPEDLPQAVAEIKRVARRVIVDVEWFTLGSHDNAFDKRLTWHRNYTQLFEPEFECTDVQSLSFAYSPKDVPLFCWQLERR